MKDGLLPEDNEDIKVVPEAQRAVWFREPKRDYWCPECERTHKPWGAIGIAHEALATAARREAVQRMLRERKGR